jgi:uncharacterized protein
MIRIGILSDTHIPERAPKLTNHLLDTFQDVSVILHAGDITDSSVLLQLESLDKDVIAVRGNMDYMGMTSELPDLREFELHGKRFGLTHGWGSPRGIRPRILSRFTEPYPDIIVFGHTHQPLIQQEDDILWINPGSPTDRLFAPYLSVAVLQIEEETVQAEIIRLT